MKTIALRTCTGISLAFLTGAAAPRAWAEPASARTKHEECYTGTVVSVNPQEHVVRVKGWLFSKSFSLGNTCHYTFLDHHAGSINDLHPGEKVTVDYRDASGVLVANRVEQKPMRYTGMVRSVSPTKHTLTLRRDFLDKTFQVAGNCKVLLNGNKSGTLADVEPGEHVTIIYELPKNGATAEQIDQTSARFTGSLTAIDLNDRTLAAESAFGAKRFSLANHCAIVLNGKLGGHLRNLRPDEKLTFSYNNVNGVDVVNRISNTGGRSAMLTAQSR